MRKLFIFFICAVLVFTPVSAVFAAKVNSSKYGTYTDIPGVTHTEIQEIEKLKSLYKKFIVGAPYGVDAFTQDDGTLGGFMMYFTSRLSTLFGIPFTLKIEDEGLPVSSVENKRDYDFFYDTSPSEDKNSIDLSMQRYIMSYRINDVSSKKSSGKITRYALLENSPIQDNPKLLTENIELSYAADYDEVINLLTQGDVDAFLDYDTADINFYKNHGIISNEFLPLITGSVHLVTPNFKLTPIISVLEKYMAHGGKEELMNLNSQGRYDYNRQKLFLSLTDFEKDYINSYTRSRTSIPYAASFDNYPICFYNDEMSEYQGISIDLLYEIEQLTGLEFVPSNNVGTPWFEILDDLTNKRTKFVSELMYSTARAEHFIWSESPYAQNSYILISRITKENIEPADITNYRVGVIIDTAYTDMFYEWFPDYKNYVEYKYYKDAFTALLKDEVDFVMGTQNLLLYSSHYLQESGIKANIVFDYSSTSAFGFNKGDEILCSIFSKAQRFVDVEKVTQSWEYRVFDYKQQSEQERLIYFTGIGILAVILIILLVVLVLKNINEKRRLETTVHTRTVELEKQVEVANIALGAKSTFLARMSHELRTPLNAILGMSNIAFQESEPESKVRKAIGDSIAAATHLLRILNDLLDMAQIESNDLALIHAPFHLKEAMRATLNLYTQTFADKNINMISNTDKISDYIVIGDAARLKQVIINLISNAVKFTPSGGTVKFNIECAVEKKNGEEFIAAEFSVHDTGIGIPPEEIENIFKTFEQANTSIASRFGGVGIGLSISQSIVHKMGGTINIESTVGKGSNFSFKISLPLFDIGEEKIIKPEITEIDCTGKRALIVDDVEINRIILLDILEESYAEAAEAGDGDEAVKMFEESEPFYYDFIFMDIQMPNMNGYEASMAIRALDRPDAKTVPIIAVTANAYKEDIEKAIESGMNMHIAKPVDIGRFLSVLEILINEKV
jgi:Osmosensitive K+ channel histidine kinase